MARVGKVYLVGAGPGDPGLLTLKGLKCLQQADLVLYDGLVNPLLLRYTAAHAERTARTQGPSGRVLRQDEINEHLISAARAGKTVVRLKGGDPFIFGRGSEEAAALQAAGVPFEVVPGITAATAAAVYAGISLTHRQHASAVAFVTGHEDPTKPETKLDYDLLARFPGTLVFYMGLHRLDSIAERLIAHGKDAATPAAVVSRATTPFQRTVVAPLAELPEVARREALHAPSLVIVGECVRLREHAAWFEDRPLFGQRIGITRPEGQADNAVEKVLELGGEPVLLPTVEILPPEDWRTVDETLQRIEDFDWIVFTSVNGVTGLLGRLWETGGDVRRLARAKLAVIGTGTAAALEEYSLRADLMPESFRAEELAAALRPHVQGKRLLWACANRGRDVLPTELTAAGAEVTRLVVYRNRDVDQLPADVLPLIERGELNWIGLSSPSIARNLSRLLTPAAREQLGQRVQLACISPVTAEAARDAGLPVAAEATVYTWDGLLEAIVERVMGQVDWH